MDKQVSTKREREKKKKLSFHFDALDNSVESFEN